MNILILSVSIALIVGLLLGYFLSQINLKFQFKKINFHKYYLATHDPLTQWPNRLLLAERFQLAIAIAQCLKKHNFLACVFFNLNNFKEVNRVFGRKIGDLLLKEVARYLAETIEEKDTLACYGGDNFVIISTTLNEEKDVVFLIKKYIDIFSKPFVIKKHEIAITCSMGISCYPTDGKSSEKLLENAEAVMFSAKSRAKGNVFLFYKDDIHKNIAKLLVLTTDLQDALERDELFLQYQPIHNIQNGSIQGVETLIRWNHSKHGLISPQEFIPLAEKTGLINKIGEWVLRTACIQYQEWINQGLPRIWIAVNISSEQFKQDDIGEKIYQIIKETKMDPHYLEIEMTESGFIDTNDSILNRLLNLTNHGIKLAVDDFGTGYSAFKYLKDFPIHTLKIDQSFIKNIDLNPENAAIVSAIISMGKTLNIKILAEGIETEGELRFLKKIQADEGQGYYFSKPIDASSIIKMFHKKSQ